MHTPLNSCYTEMSGIQRKNSQTEKYRHFMYYLYFGFREMSGIHFISKISENHPKLIYEILLATPVFTVYYRLMHLVSLLFHESSRRQYIKICSINETSEC